MGGFFGRLKSLRDKAKDKFKQNELQRAMKREQQMQKFRVQAQEQTEFANIQAKRLRAKTAALKAGRMAREEQTRARAGSGQGFASGLGGEFFGQQPKKIPLRRSSGEPRQVRAGAGVPVTGQRNGKKRKGIAGLDFM